jgi:transcriptional regulator with XRE-family HTH domain
MKEINIAKKLTEKRKEKGITQDELASYMGVSKASVSKWETGQSYPDITFLPEIATYFNITVDELIGYSPQMTKDDIRKLYHRLSAEFSSEPFEEVLKKCHEIIKKYYSCFPLLFQMAVLLVNHHMLAKEGEVQEEILKEAIALCVRIKEDSNDVWLSKQANSLEATSYLILQKPNELLDLLDGTMKPTCEDEVLLANAYQMTGNVEKAKEVLQISAYKHLLGMVGSSTSLLLIYVGETEKFEELNQRIISISELFNLNKLHPNVMLQFYLAAAQGYSMQGNVDKTLSILKKYADICVTDFFPITLHGDEFFDCIDNWFEEFDLGVKAPRDEKVIKESMIQAIASNPAFTALTEEPRYKSIIETMKIKLGGN